MASINKKKIALVEKYKQEKLRNKAMKMGVTIKSPETVFLSEDTKFGKNVVINQYVVIGKKTKIGNNVEILPFTHIENATLESNVNIGPFSRVRPGSVLSKGSRVGNFVEIKKSKIGINSKINHLSYVGDANIGKNVNIGAGTITCNYDGKKKNKTNILDGAFIGSNTSLIAPIKIGKKAIVGAGSSLTKNVKDKSLALTRSNQIEIKNYKRK
tara:strand:+ start:1339 stop:1977 length:639 start_codon:yes stop_codon:yes gene_type:complete